MGWGKRQITLQAVRTAEEDYAAFEAIGLSEVEDARVLDVGCFDGYNTVLKFSPYANITRVVGIDPCEEEVAAAVGRCADERFEFRASAFEEFDAPELFDVVYFSHVMQHLENPAAACEKAYRLLKPGGWIIVKTVDDSLKVSYPDPENVMRRLFSLYEHYVLPATEHTRFTDRYHGQKCYAHLKRAGFRDVNVRLFSAGTVGKTRNERMDLFERCAYFRRNVPGEVDSAIADRIGGLVRKWGELFESEEYCFISQSLVAVGRRPLEDGANAVAGEGTTGVGQGKAADGRAGLLVPAFGSDFEPDGHGADGLRLRPMTEDDLGAVMAIEVEAFPAPWTPVAFAMDLRHNPAARYDVALDEKGCIVGYNGWWLMGDRATIMHIASDASVRRKGVGTTLLEHACDEAVRRGALAMQLEVRSSNEAARAFYRRLQFEEKGLIPQYYSNPEEDAVVMVRSLEAE